MQSNIENSFVDYLNDLVINYKDINVNLMCFSILYNYQKHTKLNYELKIIYEKNYEYILNNSLKEFEKIDPQIYLLTFSQIKYEGKFIDEKLLIIANKYKKETQKRKMKNVNLKAMYILSCFLLNEDKIEISDFPTIDEIIELDSNQFQHTIMLLVSEILHSEYPEAQYIISEVKNNLTLLEGLISYEANQENIENVSLFILLLKIANVESRFYFEAMDFLYYQKRPSKIYGYINPFVDLDRNSKEAHVNFYLKNTFYASLCQY